MNISDYLRTALLNHVLSGNPYTPPTTVYAALYTVSPTSAGGGTEVTAADYARVSTTWATASLGSIDNSADIRFPSAGTTLSSWGTPTTLCLLDAPTGGNLLFFGPLSAPVILAMGNDFLISADDLTIALA